MNELHPEERSRILTALDRIEERLFATRGVHVAAAAASSAQLDAAELPDGASLVWAQYDGIELACGEAELLALDRHAAATADARDEGLLEDGDRVVAQRGRDTFVLVADPWEWGANIVRITDEGDREPEASSVAHLVLGWMGELTVLYDEQGEFRDAIVDEWGVLTPATLRKLLRRRLDLDPDAPRPRLELAQQLHADGKLRAAAKELDLVLRRAPEYSAAHHLAGRVAVAEGRLVLAGRAFVRAAESARDEISKTDAWAWAARVATDEAQRTERAAAVLAVRPEFAVHQVRGAQAQLEREAFGDAKELVELGLAVAPSNLELLALKRALEERSAAD